MYCRSCSEDAHSIMHSHCDEEEKNHSSCLAVLIRLGLCQGLGFISGLLFLQARPRF